jgi:Ser/Thr protein kinase RdoA (MazF antagonist)
MSISTEFISQYWPLDQVTMGPMLQRYPTRMVSGLNSTQGRFVIKAYENAAALGLVAPSYEEIHQCLSIFDYLAAHQFDYRPALLKTRSGEAFVQAQGWTVYLVEWLTGEHPQPSPAVYAQLGELAAQLNAYTDYPYPYPINVQSTIAELRQEAKRYPFQQAFLSLVEQLEVLVSQPSTLIHGEINVANAFQTLDGRLYLLDWDTAGKGPVVLETGYPLLTTFLTEDLVFHPEWAAAFYGSYTQGIGLTSDEKELVFTAALLHGLRYLKFAETNKRWARICYALAQKDVLLAAIPSKL